MEIVEGNPTTAVWHKMWIVKISDVGQEFAEWLHGQTLPVVTEDENPTDWAYYHDYCKFNGGWSTSD
jgi:hypothetical protein